MRLGVTCKTALGNMQSNSAHVARRVCRNALLVACHLVVSKHLGRVLVVLSLLGTVHLVTLYYIIATNRDAWTRNVTAVIALVTWRQSSQSTSTATSLTALHTSTSDWTQYASSCCLLNLERSPRQHVGARLVAVAGWAPHSGWCLAST